MRILMLSRVLPAHGPGGMAALAYDLATALAAAGAEVEVLTTAGGSMPGGPRLAVEALDAPAGLYSRAWWRESLLAYRRRRGWAQVVLGVSAAAHALVRAEGRRPGRPVFVFQAHGTSAGEIASRLATRRPSALPGVARQLGWALARDRSYRRYDAVAAVGEAVRASLAAWPSRLLVGATPVALIPNGVDEAVWRFDARAREQARAALGVREGAPLLLFAGRLQADKDPLCALEALGVLRIRRPQARLVLAGEGPERQRLLHRARELGLAEAMTLAGAPPRAEMASWYNAADAFLLPGPRVEGLSLAVLEALASGLEVFTTARGACDLELSCRRLAAGDVAGLAAALAGLGPREPASRLPARFTLPVCASAYLQLFERLIAERGEAR